jgi:hypothetical protein
MGHVCVVVITMRVSPMMTADEFLSAKLKQ